MAHVSPNKKNDVGRNYKTGGEVEVNETYVGGKGKNRAKLWHGNEKLKEVVFGMVERKGKAKVRHVITSGTRSLLPEIEKNIMLNTQIYSDKWGAYKTLPK